MKNIFVFVLFCLFPAMLNGQTEIAPIIRAYRLDAEDCNDGQFYLGEFVIGVYEISANILGTHANYRGWKIIIGKGWGIGSPKIEEVFNNIGGRFFYKQDENNRFHLWWDSEFSSECDYTWAPYIRVEYQAGGWTPTFTEPSRADGFFVSEPTYTKTGDLYVGATNVAGEYGAGNKLFFGGTDSNTDPTEIYRYAVSKDVTQLRVRIGDALSNGDKFIVGSSGNSAGEWTSNFIVTAGGRVGIKKESPEYELDVAGTIRATEIKVEANGNTADFVFDDNYPLRTLDEVEEFIKTKGHLPSIPSAESMEKNGVNLSEMNKLLLQKIEELTLYAIEKGKEVRELKEDRTREAEVREELEAEVKRQKSEMKELKEINRNTVDRLAKIEALLMDDKQQ
jgi:hypothetical protein